MTDLKVSVVKVSSLRPDPENARTHDERNLAAIRSSLERFGQRRPLVVWGDVVIAGNGTLEAAKSLGWERIAVARVPAGWSADEARAYALVDNRSAELAAWDAKVLAEQLVDLDSVGWDLAELGFEPLTPPGEVESHVLDDDVPSVPVDPITKPGDVWQLGAHRIMCGDCRDANQVARLVDGRRINLAFTSPPYAEQRTYDESSGFRPIPPDDYVAWFEDVQANVRTHLADDGSWFVNIKPGASGLDTELYVFDLVLAHVRRWGWHFATEFCWERSGMPKQVTQRFKNQFEPVYQFALNRWKMRPDAVRKESAAVPIPKGKGAGDTNWANTMNNRTFEHAPGLAYPGNRLPTLNESHESVGHTAPFPIGLPEWFIRAYTDEDDVVYDPFMGSGSTLIAAENQRRVALGMELSPAYVDVTVQRWERKTGETAVRVSDAEG